MPKIKRLTKKTQQILYLILGAFLICLVVSYLYVLNSSKIEIPEKNTPAAFIAEVYDTVLANYWDNISEVDLLNLFKLSMEKNTGQQIPKAFESKNKLLKEVSNRTSNMTELEKTKFISDVSGTVLTSLNPVGRSGLYTQKQEMALKNTVENINPEKDLYKDLGVPKESSEQDIEKAYQQKSKELSQDESPEAMQKLKQLTYAKDVLTQKDTKQRYDQKGVEPTIFSTIYPPNVLYVQFNKFSPTALEEFQKTFDDHKSNSQLNTLILDLRGNVGGAIDSTAHFLGFFLGKDQSAFEFYKKGQSIPFKTPTDKLLPLQKYTQIIVLIDNNTQSSAEMLAASLKKYKVGMLIGSTSKGWGTVERVFPLINQITTSEKYSLFLVHAITLRDDNQPIEGRGIEPNIDIKNSTWENELFNIYRNPALASAIKQLIK